MDKVLAELISPAQRDAVMKPIAEALTLPRQTYTSQAWFDLEVDRIFFRHWMGVLFACELPQNGDAKPFELFGMPLFAIHGDDGEIRVFHNICPYDGCLVVRHQQRQLEQLEVYYHGWRYDLRGRLLAAPYWNTRAECGPDDLDGGRGDLVAVRSEIRLGTVFINLDGQAAPVDTWLAPWHDLVSPYFAVDALVPAVDGAGTALIEKRSVNANWKTYQENASINILHEGFTHNLYRKSPEVPRVDANGRARFKTTCKGELVAFAHSRTDSAATYDAIRLPSAGHDPEQTPEFGFFTTLYPSINVPLLDSMIKVNLVIPLGPAETELRHLRFYRAEAVADRRFAAEEKAVQNLFDVVHKEDQLAIEAVQRGRASPVWEQHYYAPFWDALHHRFNRLVMEDMERV